MKVDCINKSEGDCLQMLGKTFENSKFPTRTIKRSKTGLGLRFIWNAANPLPNPHLSDLRALPKQNLGRSHALVNTRHTGQTNKVARLLSKSCNPWAQPGLWDHLKVALGGSERHLWQYLPFQSRAQRKLTRCRCTICSSFIHHDMLREEELHCSHIST